MRRKRAGKVLAQSVARRATGRVLLEGPAGTILLFRFRDSTGRPGEYQSAGAGESGPAERPEKYSWLTPGGAVKDGESARQAAARELAEETGHRVPAEALGPVVAYCGREWSADGRTFAAHDSFFWAKVDSDLVDTSGQESYERAIVVGYRWWTIAELEATDERVLPAGLASLLTSLRRDGPPATPVQLPWL